MLTGGRVPTSWTLLQNVDGVHMRWTVVKQGGNTLQCCRNPNKVQNSGFSPKIVVSQICGISPKSEEMTGKPGQGRDSETGSNWPRRGDGHRSNKFLNEIYRVIHIRKMADNENKAPPDQKCILLKS